MKQKIIDFSNGIFEYDQTKLKIEPQELVMELGEQEGAQGSFVISSCDERRIKGILYTRIPGMSFRTDSFFARASRVEFSYYPDHMLPGEELQDVIILETSAGEYMLPVKVKIRQAQEPEEDLETPFPPAEEILTELKVLRKGSGRSEAWLKKRRQEAALAGLEITLEKERRSACTKEEALAQLRLLVDSLLKEDGDSLIYPLLDMWVMLREGRKEEAGRILKKYERDQLLQMREVRARALFLYVNILFREEPEQIAAGVAQLQRLYRKHPEDWLITMFLLKLDPELKKDPRTRYLALERQFRSGTRNRLLYQEAWELLKDDLALFTRLDAFTLQIFGWASSHGLLTAKTAQAAAVQATKLKRWSLLSAGLVKACYQANPSKETIGAVCAIYIRGRRTDKEAFAWYQAGVERDAKITNLYEYFIYSLPEDYEQLLPRQVLLYFQYHNTLTSQQKTLFYCNLVKYGSPRDAACAVHERPLQEFLLKQLRDRRLNERLAWLYGRCLRVEALEDELLSALADLLFLKKLTCKERWIRQAEVRYEQLEKKITVPLTGGTAYLPIYVPGAQIALLDEHGRRYVRKVPYDLKGMMTEPRFLQRCVERLKGHLGLDLYLLDGQGKHRLNHENIEVAYRMAEASGIRESYRRMLQVEILEYERKHHGLEKLDERLQISSAALLSRRGQAIYIETLILLKEDERAYALLQKTGCRDADPRLVLRLLQRFLAEEKKDRAALRRLARQVYKKGIYTEKLLLLISEDMDDSTEELLKLWKAAEQFGLVLPDLEERLMVQALFTERYLKEVYPVYRSIEDRGGDYTICSAYLNYLSWLDFVKESEVPEGLFGSLEQHLIWEDPLAEVAGMSYLKQLSVLLFLTDAQKRLVNRLMKELGAKRRHFAFMDKLSPYMNERRRPEDRAVVEYRCNPKHKVILHYVLEYHGRKNFDYVTEQLFPVCGGVFARSFILFYGERLTWFFTEVSEDGVSVSTSCRTMENRGEHIQGGSRYQRLCRMQQALDHRQEDSLKQMMAEYEELTKLVEEKFCIR